MYKSRFICFNVKKNDDDKWIIDEWGIEKMPEQGSFKVMTSFAKGLIKKTDENNVEQE